MEGQHPCELFEFVDLQIEGAFGDLFRVVHRCSLTDCSMRIINWRYDSTNEMKILKEMISLRHENLLRYLGSYFFVDTEKYWLLTEYCEGSVFQIMRTMDATFNEKQISCIISDCLTGLSFLHSKRLFHGEINGGHILLSRNGTAKLMDFMLSASLRDEWVQHACAVYGGVHWMAPEAIKGDLLNYNKSDIWSIGITAIELWDGFPPYSDRTPMRALFLIPSDGPPPTVSQPDSCSAHFNRFLSLVLSKDPQSRPSAEETLQHPIFAPSNLIEGRTSLLPLTRAFKLRQEDGRLATDRKDVTGKSRHPLRMDDLAINMIPNTAVWSQTAVTLCVLSLLYWKLPRELTLLLVKAISMWNIEMGEQK